MSTMMEALVLIVTVVAMLLLAYKTLPSQETSPECEYALQPDVEYNWCEYRQAKNRFHREYRRLDLQGGRLIEQMHDLQQEYHNGSISGKEYIDRKNSLESQLDTVMDKMPQRPSREDFRSDEG